MKNKLLSAILVLALLLSNLAIPALAEDEIPTSGTCGETVTWALDETGLLTISGTGPMTDYATYTETPWYESIDRITALVIGDGVTTIGDRSFYGCEALATVTLPEGITTIGNSAFYSCVGLTEVLLPQTLTAIGDYAFSWCETLAALELPASLERIGAYAFTSCASLTEVQLSAAVTQVGTAAFSSCTALAQIVVDPENPAYSSDSAGVLFDKDGTTLLAFPGGRTERYVAPTGTATIADRAFYGCAGLTEVQLPEGVTSIGYSAFAWCDALKTVTLPQTLERISGYAFSRCEALTGITLPESLTELGSWAFECCFSLRSISIPEGLTTISDFLFFECSSLKDVTIPQSVTTIGSHAFYVCKSLKTIELPANLTTLSDWSFAECYALQSMTIPASVTTIGDHAFLYDTELQTMEFYGSAPTIGESAFGSVTATAYYPAPDSTWTEEVRQNYGGTITWEGVGEPAPAPALTAPQILSCYSKAQTSVKVTWTIVDGAAGYELWRSTTPDDESSWQRAKTIMSGTTDRYTNQGLTIGTTYYYAVRAYALDENGERIYSDFSAIDHMPAAVVWDGPYSNATFRIRLRWQQVDGCHGYQIWRQNEDGSWRVVKTLGDKGNELTDDQGATTAYSNTDLTPGRDYIYKIRAFRITEDGRKIFGAYSDEITVATMPEAPVLTATASGTGVQLTWEAVNGAAGYHIWMSTDPDTGFTITKTITDGTSYTKQGLQSGTTYYFKIRAYVEVDGKKTFGDYSETLAATIQ